MDLNALRLTPQDRIDIADAIGEPLYPIAKVEAIADAQLAKALWGVANWLEKLAKRNELYEGLYWEIIGDIEEYGDHLLAAGIPKEGE